MQNAGQSVGHSSTLGHGGHSTATNERCLLGHETNTRGRRDSPDCRGHITAAYYLDHLGHDTMTRGERSSLGGDSCNTATKTVGSGMDLSSGLGASLRFTSGLGAVSNLSGRVPHGDRSQDDHTRRGNIRDTIQPLAVQGVHLLMVERVLLMTMAVVLLQEVLKKVHTI